MRRLLRRKASTVCCVVSVIATAAVLIMVRGERTRATEDKLPPQVAPRDRRHEEEDAGAAKKLFSAMDTNADGKLSRDEIAKHIAGRITRHMQQSLRKNMQAFFALDKMNPNGQVEWNEWLSSFQKELSASQLTERQTKEKVAAAKAAWAEAARSNPDHLNIDEFLAFTHPEFSHPLILQRVDEMLLWSDTNKDGSISTDEYTRARRSVPDAHGDFSLLDADGDGVLSRRELIVLHDAKSSFWSASEAKSLLAGWDTDRDGFLQLPEFAAIPSSLRSQYFSPDKMFHDVF